MIIINRTKIWSVTILAYLFLSVVSVPAATDKMQPEQSDKIFDKAFLQSIKNVLLYEQIVKIVGAPGARVGVSSIKIPGDKYHWNGRENSSFNIRVSSGKIVDANVKTPDGRILSIEGNGEVTDYGK